MMKFHVTLALCTTLLRTVIGCKDVIERWDGEKLLSESINFHVQWKVKGNDLIIALSAASEGWLGFGIPEQTSGSMIGADIVTVRYINNKPIAEDRYVPWAAYPYKPVIGRSHFPSENITVDPSPTLFPELDCHQDWNLIKSIQDGECRMFLLTRHLDSTEDSLYDRAIDLKTRQRVIWAHGASDELLYHGSKRGTSAINFGGQDAEDESCEECYKLNLTMSSYPILAQETTYTCQSFTLNNTEDEHIVAIEPFIDNTPFVHHILVHSCPNSSYFYDHFHPIPCGTSGNKIGNIGSSPLTSDCTTLVYAWAVGGGKLILPKEAGFLASESGIRNVIIEIHYDNPSNLANERDSTTIALTISKKLRAHHAGVLIAGDPFLRTHALTPGESEIHTVAACSPACTSQWNEPIHLFSSFLHMHSFGHRMWTNRVNKIGELVETTNSIEFWNFEFQQLTKINTTVDPGDTLYVHCDYDTSKWPKTVLFGPRSLDEMCMDFLFYYPAQYSRSGAEFGTCGGLLNINDLKAEFNLPQEYISVVLQQFPELAGMLSMEICAGEFLIVDREVLGVALPFQTRDPTFKDGEYEQMSSFAQIASNLCPSSPPIPTPGSAFESDDDRYDFMILPIDTERSFKFYWSVVDNSPAGSCHLSVQMTVEGNKWLAFGVGTSMTSSRVVIALDSSQSKGFSSEDFAEYSIGLSRSKSAVVKGTSESGLLGEVEIVLNGGVKSVRFNISSIDGKKFNIGCRKESRRLGAAESEDTADSLIFAVGEGASFQQHAHTGVVTLDWINANSTKDKKSSHLAHGILMSISFGILLPSGVFSGLSKHENWFTFHRSFILLSVLFALVGLALALSFVDDHFSRPHHIVGLVVVLMLLVNSILGLLRPVKDSESRSLWLSFHRLISCATAVLGFVNIYLGAVVKTGSDSPFFGTSNIAVAVIFIVVGVLIILLAVGLRVTKNKALSSTAQTTPHPKYQR